MTNKAVYTPGDKENGLAKAGESVSFTVWANNGGNVDIHDVEMTEDGENDTGSCA